MKKNKKDRGVVKMLSRMPPLPDPFVQTPDDVLANIRRAQAEVMAAYPDPERERQWAEYNLRQLGAMRLGHLPVKETDDEELRDERPSRLWPDAVFFFVLMGILVWAWSL